ncbi:MAG: DUF4838 domain-containing protein [Lentisphaerae bacterium]|nr:DUF4838 domain-containing protein [Lentisphaerota bacterium]
MLLVRAACAQETYLQTFPVESNRYYRLTFEIEPLPDDGLERRWVLHPYTGEGDQLFDGSFEWGWQRLVPGQTLYRHEFLAAEEAVELRLGFRSTAPAPPLKSASLTPVTPANVVLNGDFALGPGNQSGWSEMNLASIINEAGAGLLQVNLNGYALSDYFLVEPGGGCNLMPGAKTWPGVTLLAYDRQRRLIGAVPRVATNNPPMRLPAEAVYGRMLFNTTHDHIPAYCTNRITFTGLVRHGEPLPGAGPGAPPPRADEEIVLLPGSDPREVHAARELRHWIAKLTGRLPPLLARPSARPNIKLFIGAAQAAGFAEDLAWLAGSDGYAVRRLGNAIHIFGAKPRGTLYGVHAFLERNSDIIWPRPHPDFEAFWTPLENLAYTEADVRSRPAFEMRHISRGQGGYRFQQWMMRNGLNTDFRLHTGFDYLLWECGAPSSYGDSHIGWIGAAADADITFYPLVDGERSVSRWRQPCYTHPETAGTIAAAIRRALDRMPEQPAEHISSIIADNWTVCACERCMQPIELPDGSRLAPQSPYAVNDPLFFSTRNFIMLNAVAENLAPDYPGLRLITHAYIFTAEPPRVKLHPMILPQFAAYPTQNARFPIRDGKGQVISGYTADIWQRRFDAWGAWHPEGLGYFGYYYTAGFNALADTAAVDFRDLAARGGIQAHTEGFPPDDDTLSTWDVDGAEKWIMARLMWDPGQDPNVLRDTYFRKVFRGAAPSITAFHALISNGWHDAASTLFVNCHATSKDLFEGLLVGPGIEQTAREKLVQAVAAADHPASQRLAERMLAHFDAYREAIGRRVVPLVEEATEEWSDAVSPHWEKAFVFADFKQVTDWRRPTVEAADPPTEVRVMHDGTRLYIRAKAFDANVGAVVAPPPEELNVFPNGDRVEFMVADTAVQNRRLLAVGPHGHRYASPDGGFVWEIRTVVQSDGWVALLALPLAGFGADPQPAAVKLRAGRVYRHARDERQESTPSGASLFNLHESFWMDLVLQ